MKKRYEINEFKNRIFECMEYLSECKTYTLLTGKFIGYGKKYTFIKSEKDKELPVAGALKIE